MGLPSISLSRSTALQLGAVAAIGVATVASGGTLAPLLGVALAPAVADVVGKAVEGLIPNILSGLFSDKVKGDQERADKARRSKQNHDVQRAINTAIAKCIGDAAVTYSKSEGGKAYLEKVAAAMIAKPLSLELTPGTDAIDEANLTEILTSDAATIRNRKPLTVKQWEVLVGQYAYALGQETMQVALEHAAGHLEGHFCAALVQALKDAGAESDPAWFAVVLRFLGEIHADVKEIKGDVRAQSAAIAALQQAFKDHAEAITKAFAAIPSGCDPAELAAIKKIAADLSIDIPEMKAALGRIEEHARIAAEASVENGSLLRVFGFTPLIAPNLPPLPVGYVRRQGPLGLLQRALRPRGEREAGKGLDAGKDASVTASVTGRAQAAAGGGYGKSVLAFAYAHEHLDVYQGGVFVASCEGRTIVESLTSLLPDHEGVRTLPAVERAKIVRAKLSGGQRTLLILDNIDTAEHWRAFRDSGLLPSRPCDILITTRADNIKDVQSVPIDRLEDAEAKALLRFYRPWEPTPPNDEAIASVLRETECIAALVAAVGMAMKEDQHRDWPTYAAWLATAQPNALPDAGDWIKEYRDYPYKTAAILDDLRRRLHPAARRALDYAALLPADMIPRDWLEWLLTADVDPARGVETVPVERDTIGQPRPAPVYVQRLRDRGILRRFGEDDTRWSLHRLHRKRAMDHLASDPTARVAMLSNIAACAAARRGDLVEGANGKGSGDISFPIVLNEQSLRWELGILAKVCEMLRDAGLAASAAEIGLWVGSALYVLGRWPEALTCLPLTPDNGDRERMSLNCRTLGGCLSLKAVIQHSQGNLVDAKTNALLAVGLLDSCSAAERELRTGAFSNLAMIELDVGSLEESLRFAEKAVAIALEDPPRENLTLAAALSNLAIIQLNRGDLSVACKHATRAMEIATSYLESSHPGLLPFLNTLSEVHRAGNDFVMAQRATDESIGIAERNFGSSHPSICTLLSNRSMHQRALNDLSGARDSIDRCIDIAKHVMKSTSPRYATFLINLVSVQLAQRDIGGSRRTIDLLGDILRMLEPSDSPLCGIAFLWMARVSLAENDHPSARKRFSEALFVLRKHFDDTHPRIQAVLKEMKTTGGVG